MKHPIQFSTYQLRVHNLLKQGRIVGNFASLWRAKLEANRHHTEFVAIHRYVYTNKLAEHVWVKRSDDGKWVKIC